MAVSTPALHDALAELVGPAHVLRDPVARARLKALVDTQDGFVLAEEDFRLRREGDVLGFAQSGFPRLRVASLQRDDHRDLAVARID